MNTSPFLPIRLANPLDAMRFVRGEIDAVSVRSIEVEAIVDMRVKTIVVPTWIMTTLDVQAAPLLEIRVFDRFSTFEIEESRTDTTFILGRIPFSFFDLVLDAKQECYAPNPKNGGQWVLDCVSVF
jgi:hypothetical protein